jgi:hypothetical protein
MRLETVGMGACAVLFAVLAGLLFLMGALGAGVVCGWAGWWAGREVARDWATARSGRRSAGPGRGRASA